jgi:hypothetical protein
MWAGERLSCADRTNPPSSHLVFDSVRDLEPSPAIDGVTVQSLLDLRANKLTCLLSRAEPRDLVDVLIPEMRAGFRA